MSHHEDPRRPEESTSSEQRTSNPRRSRPSLIDPYADPDPRHPRTIPDGQRYYVNPLFGRNEDNAPEHIPEGPSHYGTSTQNTNIQKSNSLAMEFATTIGINAYVKSATFIKDNPDVVTESDRQAKYIDEAVRLLAANKRDAAFSFVEKFLFIDEFSKNPKFFRLLNERHPGTVASFNVKFKQLLQVCQARAAKLPTTAPSQRHDRAGDLDHDKDKTTSQFRQLAISSKTQSPAVTYSATTGGDRHSVAIPDIHGRTNDALATPVIANPNVNVDRHLLDAETGMQVPAMTNVDEYRRPRAHSGSTVDTNRFKSLPAKQWDWFKIGQVFLWRTYQQDNTVSEEAVSQGAPPLQKIRPMVIVARKDGFFQAVSVATYGGHGLRKHGLRDSNIKAHALIYIKGQETDWFTGEPHGGKRPVVVEPIPGSNFSFHRASRINFEKTWPIECNERILKIGTVAQSSMTYLELYWKEELPKRQDNNRGTKKQSSQAQSSQGYPKGQQSRHSVQQASQTQKGGAIQQSQDQTTRSSYQVAETTENRHSIQQEYHAPGNQQRQPAKAQAQQNPQNRFHHVEARQSRYENAPDQAARHMVEQPSRSRGVEEQIPPTRYEDEKSSSSGTEEEWPQKARSERERAPRPQYEDVRTQRPHFDDDQALRRRHGDRAAAIGRRDSERTESVHREDDRTQHTRRHENKKPSSGGGFWR